MPWVGVLGPDGAGKSTFIELISNRSSIPEATAFELRHWRPNAIFRRAYGGPVTEPHGQKPRGGVLSVIMLMVPLLDWWIGYWVDIRPCVASGKLLVFDRFFADILADPRRYRYGGPRWCLKLFARLIPMPPVVIVLDAPGDVIHSRKQEVTLEEIERQRKSYRAIALHFPNGCVIDATQPAEAVACEAAGAIRKSMLRR